MADKMASMNLFLLVFSIFMSFKGGKSFEIDEILQSKDIVLVENYIADSINVKNFDHLLSTSRGHLQIQNKLLISVLLLVCGDVHPCPGPRKPAEAYGVCDRGIRSNN